MNDYVPTQIKCLIIYLFMYHKHRSVCWIQLHFHNAIVVILFRSCDFLFFAPIFFYVPMSMYVFHTRIQHNRNYGWLCLLFSYGVMCWITLFIWLWWLSEDLYFGICLDSPWSVFGCAAYFRKWPNNHKASW